MGPAASCGSGYRPSGSVNVPEVDWVRRLGPGNTVARVSVGCSISLFPYVLESGVVCVCAPVGTLYLTLWTVDTGRDVVCVSDISISYRKKREGGNEKTTA